MPTRLQRLTSPPPPPKPRSEYETWLVSEYADRGSLADAIKQQQFKAAGAPGCDMVGGGRGGLVGGCATLHSPCL